MIFRRVTRGLEHTTTLLLALLTPSKRTLLGRMIRFSRALPRYFDHPLPHMMAQLTPTSSPPAALEADDIRRLADAVAAWHIRSPLGICLRRSLLRYYFLHEVNVSVRVIFGARLKAEGGGLGGHAWLTLNGEPYYENPHDYVGFVAMYVYP